VTSVTALQRELTNGALVGKLFIEKTKLRRKESSSGGPLGPVWLGSANANAPPKLTSHSTRTQLSAHLSLKRLDKTIKCALKLAFMNIIKYAI